MSSSPGAEPVCPFFKPKGAKASLRKRPIDTEPALDDGDDGIFRPAAAIKKKENRNTTTTTSAEVQTTTASTPTTEPSDVLKPPKEGESDATRIDLVAPMKGEKVMRTLNEGGVIEEALDKEGVYRGLAGYTNFRDSNKRVASSSASSSGPVRAATSVRSTTRFDFQPAICKDYKETGWCGYGDNCVFLHDRSDYKTGWQLEREWAATQKKMAVTTSNGTTTHPPNHNKNKNKGDDAAGDDQQYPFACLKCKQRWSNTRKPVITKCKHFFCEACLMEWFRKTTQCPYCKQPTGGVFNTPKRLVAKIEAALHEADLVVDPNDDKLSGSTAKPPQDARLDKLRR